MQKLRDTSSLASTIFRYFPIGFSPYIQLARWDRPIGWELLLWPCLWSTALAHPDFQTLLLVSLGFLIGSISMRGAGCTYNDIIDKDIDAQVERTALRPIPSGTITLSSAYLFLFIQLFIGFLSLLYLMYFSPSPIFTFTTAICSLLIVLIYPFMKRITFWAQLFLGLSFSWGIFMGSVVILGTLPFYIFLFYLGCICWVIGYDTIYAHQDSDDDSLLGLRSTALLFGERSSLAIFFFYLSTIILFFFTFYFSGIGIFGFLGLFLGLCHLLYQAISLDITDSYTCLRLFRLNRYFGLIVFFGLLCDRLF